MNNTMKAMLVRRYSPIESHPLELAMVPCPEPGRGEILLRVSHCGLCHTDLHVAEGDICPPRLPIIPGHQIIGVVETCGPGAHRFSAGMRVGAPWLNHTCGDCGFCRSGRENLCREARFTGFHAQGGFAEYFVIHEDFACPIPADFTGEQAAPLLCAGIIGYRALRLSEVKPGERLGLFGFGASAHIAIQVAVHQGCHVYVFSRSSRHRQLAQQMGAAWVGQVGDPLPQELNAGIMYAPAGELVPPAMAYLERGGTLALASVWMSAIPALAYENHLYYEKTLRSVTAATRRDAAELLELAERIPIHTEVDLFSLEQANEALEAIKHSRLHGAAAVLQIQTDTTTPKI